MILKKFRCFFPVLVGCRVIESGMEPGCRENAGSHVGAFNVHRNPGVLLQRFRAYKAFIVLFLFEASPDGFAVSPDKVRRIEIEKLIVAGGEEMTPRQIAIYNFGNQKVKRVVQFDRPERVNSIILQVCR